jgi:hypothetical protein
MKSLKRPDERSSTNTARAASAVVSVVIMVMPANTHEFTNQLMSCALAYGSCSARLSTYALPRKSAYRAIRMSADRREKKTPARSRKKTRRLRPVSSVIVLTRPHLP